MLMTLVSEALCRLVQTAFGLTVLTRWIRQNFLFGQPAQTNHLFKKKKT